jgi:hypothetical protein
MFSSIRIAIILTMLATAGVGFLWIKNLQRDLEIARENVAKLEVAVQVSEASIKTLQADAIRLGELNTKLSADLQKSEQYGDELRATLQKHNLTALAQRKPGLIEDRMQDATNKLWNDLRGITDPNGVLDVQSGTANSNSN